MMQKAKNILSSFSKTATFVVAVLIAISIARSIVKIISAQQQVEIARIQLKTETERQQKLEDELKKIQSLEFKEKEARDKLGLSREGEVIVIMPEEDVLRRLSPRTHGDDKKGLPEPNWERWLKLFFDN